MYASRLQHRTRSRSVRERWPGKMDQRMIIVCSVVGSLGVLSAILGFSAEGTKLTISDLYVGGGVCLYPQNPALGLGVCAAIFLIVAQIVFAVVGGCCGCCKSRAIPSEANRIIGVVCAVSSWISAMIAFGLLAEGAAWNSTGTRYSSVYGYCYVLKDGIFAGGAVLTLVATALGVTSYIMLRKQPAAAAATSAVPKAGEQMPAGGAGIAMGQPQFPQQASPQGQGYGQAPPSYPQYSPSPQGQPGYGQAPNAQFPPAASVPYGQAPNPHYPPPPAQGYGSNQQQQQFPPPPAQGYGVHAQNQQYPPPPAAHGYGAHAPNQQFPPASPPPAHGYGPHTPPTGHEQV
ncbi:basic salivary proline-rich protein 1-like [Triticum dicoccoides]|uniref:basic salivary proline-rich protein 1-like n=1 Tax=Triticum dicoccoides TaxID=85692 RepID=UPI0018906A6C|nr:basic salivary proline-rich protein 1-like [Triticum dicoccoides]